MAKFPPITIKIRLDVGEAIQDAEKLLAVLRQILEAQAKDEDS
jgi:hypothetical protein